MGGTAPMESGKWGVDELHHCGSFLFQASFRP